MNDTKRQVTHALFTADGRLGNQMFQAAFLDSLLSRGDRLTVTGMEDLLKGFDWDRLDVRLQPPRRWRQSTKRWYRRLGSLAVQLGIVNGVEQPRTEFSHSDQTYRLHGERVIERRGLFRHHVYIEKGYFQNAALAEEASFRLKSEHVAAARTFLDKLPAGPRAFVHVRRGDYANWKIFGRSPLLRFGYFQRGIDAIREIAPDTQFIVLSDDTESVARAFPDLHVFAGTNVYEDFGLMTLCDGGVISNSTLSWWGGFFCGRTLPVIAPQGFLACGLGFEYPPGIVADWMTPIEP